MIFDASSLTLDQNPSALPNVSEGILSWFQPMSFDLLTKTVVNHQLVETGTPVLTQGVRQPMKPQDLKMKPEGQREWKWETMHALRDLILKPDDIISFNGVPYRVMEKLDWKEYGFVEYHIVEAYT
jgi:hypothetical protein